MNPATVATVELVLLALASEQRALVPAVQDRDLAAVRALATAHSLPPARSTMLATLALETPL
ncbi:hypothetical protein [Actinomadura kijaniata]|uniref:hypothetical protein n=1 Tax=Actinomadura kijaniata TaxID=46161 RepID=UPI00082A9714|nr:hypothetical protein [Actinomadura kijaniata]